MIQFLILMTALGVGPKYPAATDEHVNDFAGVLAAKDVDRIRAVCQATLRDRGVPIVVATISSLAEYDAADWTIERYATNLYNEWGIGEKTTNRGVLLLVAVRDRKLRIATGTGLGNLDGPARQVIDGVIVPRFKSGDLSGGVAAGVEAIAKWFQPAGQTAPATGPSPAAAPPERVPGGEGAGWQPHGTPIIRNAGGGGLGCFFWLILILIGFAVLSAVLRRSGGYGGPGGYYGGGGGGWGRFLMGGVAGFLGSQLLQGGRRGRQWDSSDSSGSIFGGSSGGGFFGGGSSGGGSSFGGGSSSGGGASGSW